MTFCLLEHAKGIHTAQENSWMGMSESAEMFY